MAIIVIALGVVMVLGGTYEVYFGNTYISVERGWSAFISGTVLLTGGLMTIALGLGIKALSDLKTTLVRQLSAGTGLPVPVDVVNVPEVAVDPVHVEPGFAQPDFAGSPLASNTIEPPAVDREIPPHVVPSSAALSDALAPARVPDLPAIDPPHPPVDGAAEPPRDHTMPRPPTHVNEAELIDREQAAAAEAQAGRMRPTLGTGIPLESTAPEHDWLERSFAELGQEFGSGDDLPSHVADEHHDLHSHASEAGTAYADEALAHHETLAPELPAHDAVDASLHGQDQEHHRDEPAKRLAPTAAVIGRYEAEGTSYVMYADGSIEAQSEAGVFRFASMAELKAFIEG